MLFILFPNPNPHIDAWYYAACVKHQEDLLMNHHLLYNLAGFVWHQLISFFIPQIEAINSLNLLNSLVGTASLFCIYSIFLKLNSQKNQAFLLSLLCGVCFGFWRYSIEAETYIIPLFLSLLSTNLYFHKSKWLLSGFLAALSILFHQVHLWWGLAFVFGLYFSDSSVKEKFKFIIPFAIIPIVYVLVFLTHSTHDSFFTFILGEYQGGHASIQIKPMSFILTVVNFFRTFFQLHGDIMLFIVAYFEIFIFLILLAFYFGAKTWSNRSNYQFNRITTAYPHVKWGLILAFIFHLLFAFLSDGNVEFMVMLPFLIVAILVSKFQIQAQGLIRYIVVITFVWNFTFGVLIHYIFNTNNSQTQVKIALEHPNDLCIWSNQPLIKNQILYKKGFNYPIHFIKHDTVQSGTLYLAMKKGKRVFTDLGIKKSRWTRAGMIENKEKTSFYNYFNTQKIDSFENIYGKNYIEELILSDKLLFLQAQ